MFGPEFITTVLLIAFSALYWFCYFTPRIRHPRRFAQLLSEVRARRRGEPDEARDPAKNGYLDPTFHPYWGLEDGGEEINSIVKDWSQFGFFHRAKAVDHERLGKTKDYRRARARFAQLEKKLANVVENPCFVIPERLAYSTNSTMSLQLMYLFSALSAQAESKVSEGRTGEAFDTLILTIRLLRLFQKSSIGTERMSCDAYLERTLLVLSGLIPVTYADSARWKQLAEACGLENSPEECFAQHLEVNLAREYHICLDPSYMLVNGEFIDPTPKGVGQLFFEVAFRALNVKAREKRILANALTDIPEQWRRGEKMRGPGIRFSLSSSMLDAEGSLLTIYAMHYRVLLSLHGVSRAAGLLADYHSRGMLPEKPEAGWDPGTARLTLKRPGNLPEGAWRPLGENPYSSTPWLKRTERAVIVEFSGVRGKG